MMRSSVARLLAVAALLFNVPALAARPGTPEVVTRGALRGTGARDYGDLDAAWKAVAQLRDGKALEGGVRSDLVNFVGQNERTSLTPFEAATVANGLAEGRWDSTQTKTNDGTYAVGDRVAYETPARWKNRLDPKAGKGVIVAVKDNVMQILATDHNGQPVIFQLSRFQVKKKLARALDDGQAIH